MYITFLSGFDHLSQIDTHVMVVSNFVAVGVPQSQDFKRKLTIYSITFNCFNSKRNTIIFIILIVVTVTVYACHLVG